MSEESDFRQRVRRVGALVEKIESISDPEARTCARELMRLVMEFHGVALDRALDVLARGEQRLAFIEQLGRDPIVSGLLAIYGLHPDSLETRVRKAVKLLEAKLRREGATIELLGLDEGVLRVRLTPGSHTCSSAAKALRSTVEDAIYEAAPDVGSLLIEGLDERPANGFVNLDELTGAAPLAGNLKPAATRAAVTNHGG